MSGCAQETCASSTSAAKPNGTPGTLRARLGGRWTNSNLLARWPTRTRHIAVHCKSGYRSAIACSLLQRAGFQNVINVIGGLDAWRQEQLPVAFEAAVEA